MAGSRRVPVPTGLVVDHRWRRLPAVRLYFVGRRIHHGRWGKWLMKVGGAAFAVGVCAVAHDWPDRPWPYTD